MHWGTFSLAMHAWDQPAEELLRLGETAGAQLVMPRLGEAVEPEHAARAQAWWRGVHTAAQPRQPDASPTLPKAMSWPID